MPDKDNFDDVVSEFHIEPSPGRRPKNDSERSAYDFLASEGWTPTKRGWPDFICFKDGEILAVEVKRAHNHGLKSQQYDVIRALLRHGMACARYSPDVGMQKFSLSDSGKLLCEGKRKAYGLDVESIAAKLESLWSRLSGISERCQREPAASLCSRVAARIAEGYTRKELFMAIRGAATIRHSDSTSACVALDSPKAMKRSLALYRKTKE